ncbi:uncharacterized protein LOC111866715 [Cryptotermes secundus]|uniref:uncharacterized protein LOC111866715 n=1 Tax=Cryptotermes secundus TaxID=105785 RepID=UPI000CD7D203|nr:uncharacterized protein LOC111866715 [Cryptotermes secundus]
MKILKQITACLASDTTDSASFEPCSIYTEEKKQISKETINTRTFSIDFISDLIQQHQITSFEDFQHKVPTPTKIQLLKQMGYVSQNIIKTLIKIFVTEKQQQIKSKHYFQLIVDNYSPSDVIPTNVTWLTDLFSSNQIDISDFFAKFIVIHSLALPKINSLVIKGSANTGKSLLLQLLLDDTKPTRISREKDKLNFHLDQLPSSTSIVFEEPIIDQTTIGTLDSARMLHNKYLCSKHFLESDFTTAERVVAYQSLQQVTTL